MRMLASRHQPDFQMMMLTDDQQIDLVQREVAVFKSMAFDYNSNILRGGWEIELWKVETLDSDKVFDEIPKLTPVL